MLYDYFSGADCSPIEVAERLLTSLEAGGDATESLLRHNSSELSIVIRLYYAGEDEPMWTPPFHLKPQFIARLHRFGLHLDLDLYMFSADDHSGSVPTP